MSKPQVCFVCNSPCMRWRCLLSQLMLEIVVHAIMFGNCVKPCMWRKSNTSVAIQFLQLKHNAITHSVWYWATLHLSLNATTVLPNNHHFSKSLLCGPYIRSNSAASDSSLTLPSLALLPSLPAPDFRFGMTPMRDVWKWSAAGK